MFPQFISELEAMWDAARDPEPLRRCIADTYASSPAGFMRSLADHIDANPGNRIERKPFYKVTVHDNPDSSLIIFYHEWSGEVDPPHDHRYHSWAAILEGGYQESRWEIQHRGGIITNISRSGKYLRHAGHVYYCPSGAIHSVDRVAAPTRDRSGASQGDGTKTLFVRTRAASETSTAYDFANMTATVIPPVNRIPFAEHLRAAASRKR